MQNCCAMLRRVPFYCGPCKLPVIGLRYIIDRSGYINGFCELVWITSSLFLAFWREVSRLGWIAFSLANLLIEPNIRSEQIVFILCLKCALGEVVG